MPTIVPGDLPWRPAQAILPLAEAAQPVTTGLDARLPLSLLEVTRRGLVTFLRTDQLEVDAGPRGLLRGLLRRHFPQLRIHVTAMPLDGGRAQVDQLHVMLDNVRVKLTLRGPMVRIGAVRFRATINQAQLNRLVELPSVVDRFSITPNGFTFHTFTGLPVFTTVELKDNQLVVAPTSPVPIPWLPRIGWGITLPNLPVGAKLSQLALYDGLLIAAGSVRNTATEAEPAAA